MKKDFACQGNISRISFFLEPFLAGTLRKHFPGSPPDRVPPDQPGIEYLVRSFFILRFGLTRNQVYGRLSPFAHVYQKTLAFSGTE